MLEKRWVQRIITLAARPLERQWSWFNWFTRWWLNLLKPNLFNNINSLTHPPANTTLKYIPAILCFSHYVYKKSRKHVQYFVLPSDDISGLLFTKRPFPLFFAPNTTVVTQSHLDWHHASWSFWYTAPPAIFLNFRCELKWGEEFPRNEISKQNRILWFFIIALISSHWTTEAKIKWSPTNSEIIIFATKHCCRLGLFC